MNAIDITYIWLLAGVLLLILEAIGFPGVGLMFAGLGALTTGAALYGEWIEASSTQTQFILFFTASAVWAGLLWKPIQAYAATNKDKEYQNIIGQTAYVSSASVTRHDGEVSWSGTIMQARLANDAGEEQVATGSEVEIIAVSGTVLTVKPKL